MDGTVAGKFELNGEQPLTTMQLLNREGERLELTLRDVGRTMEHVGGASSTRGIQTYRTEVRGLQDDVRSAGRTVESTFRSMERTVLDSSAKQVAAIRELRNEIDGLGRDRGRASVDVSGLDESLAKIKLLDAELDRLNRKRAVAEVAVRQSASSDVQRVRRDLTNTGAPTTTALTRDFTAIRSWERGHPTFWGGTGSVMSPIGAFGGGGGRTVAGGGGGGGGMFGAFASGIEDAGSAARASEHDFNVFGLGIKEMMFLAAGALPVIQALGGAVVALGGSFAMAAEGAGVVGVAGASALATGIGSIIAVAKPAVTSITEVWKATTQLEQAQMNTPQHTLEQMQNTDQLTQAQKALTQAQYQARSAQMALTEARREARRELENLNLTTKEGVLNERQAELQLKQAKLTLSEEEIRQPGATPQEEINLQTARLTTQQAQLGIQRSRQQERVNREKLTLAQRRGVSGNPQVLAAENAEREARNQITLAHRQMVEARLTPIGAVSQAEEALRKALARAPAGTQALVHDALLFRKEWHAATRSASADFVGLLNDAERTGKRMLPILSSTSNASMRALRVQGDQFLKYLASDSTKRWIESSERMFTSNLRDLRLTGQNVADTLMHVSEAAAPFLHETLQGIEHMTHGWATSTEDVRAFRARLKPLYEDTKAWWHLMDSATHLLGDLFRAGAPSGTSMVEHFTMTMDRWDTWIRQNPAKVRSFFHSTVESAEKLLSALGGIVKTLNEGATLLRPLLNDLSDLVGLTNALGIQGQPGLFAGIVGAYQGFRGRSAGPGAMMGMVGRRGGGSGVLSGSATASAAAAAAGGAAFLAPVVPFSRQVATPEAFASKYGLLPGAHYAAPVSTISRDLGVIDKMAGGLRSAAGRLASGARGFAEAAAPMVALTAGLQLSAGQNPTHSSSLLGSILSGGLTGGAIGLMLPGGPISTAAGAIVGAGGAAFAHVQEQKFTGGPFQKRGETILGSVQKLIQEGKYQQAHNTLEGIYAGRQTFTTDEDKELAPHIALAHEVIGQGLGAQYQQAFGIRVQGGMSPRRAMAVTVREVLAEQRKLGPEGARQLDKVMGEWAHQQARSNPRLLRQVNMLSHGIEGYFKENMESLRVINGQIYSNTSAAWEQIAESLISPVERATESVTHGFTVIQREAIHGLTEMGFSRSQAQDIVRGVAAGGKTAHLAGQVAKRQSEGRGGEAIQVFQQAALNKRVEKRRASGGRLGGVGNKDTLRMIDGGLAAPGELVLNHHTEADVNRDLALAGKAPLGFRVATEHRQHSQPPSRSIQYGILPGRASGGRLGPLDMGRLLAEANRISNMDSTYVYGGGHVTPAPANPPWDCSSSWSRLLQSAGEDIPTMVSGDFMRWGLPGPGQVTLYANPSHVYGSINGRFWGTSLSRPHGGAGWFQGAPRPGFVVRHAPEVVQGAGRLGAGTGISVGPGGELSFGGVSTSLGGVPGAMVLAAGNAYGTMLAQKVNASLGSNVAGVSGGGGTSSSNEALGKQMMIQHGWGSGEWPSLRALWTQESGWNANAVNPTSGAYGIPQALGHGHPYNLGDPRAQIKWGLNYIAERYGSPSAAEAHERAFNWYATGGRIPRQFAGWFQRGGTFTTDRPALFGAGDGQATGHTEHVTVRPARKSSLSANSAGARPIHVEMKFDNVTVGDVADFKKVVREAANEAAERLLHALEAGRGDEGGMW
jgi:hypothetical protein